VLPIVPCISRLVGLGISIADLDQPSRDPIVLQLLLLLVEDGFATDDRGVCRWQSGGSDEGE